MASHHPDVSQPPGTLTLVPFEAWHLESLALQPSQAALSPTLTRPQGVALKAAGPCYSALAGMTVVACAGVVEFWPGRSQVWAVLSDQMPRYQKSIHKAVTLFLAGYHVRRLECVVDPRSEPAVRWAAHLGFVLESQMWGYTPQGDPQFMLIRKGE